MAGWIKLHRSLLSWEWYSDHNTLLLFIHLLLKSNYEDSKYRGHHVPAGSCVTGRLSLAETLGISESCVRTALDHLKISGEVTIKSHSKFSIITITKWKDYQQDDQQVTSNRPASDQQVTTSKEGKKERKKEVAFATPPSVSVEVWEAWMEIRRQKKCSFTERAYKMILKDLAAWYLEGYDLDKVISASVKGGWTSLYHKPEHKAPKKARAML